VPWGKEIMLAQPVSRGELLPLGRFRGRVVGVRVRSGRACHKSAKAEKGNEYEEANGEVRSEGENV
jgi:hypothetical protein